MKVKRSFPKNAALLGRIGAIALILMNMVWLSCAVRSQSALAEEPDSIQRNMTESAGSQVPEYRLGFGDVIDVKFFNASQFNESVIVRPDGRISLQRVGDIKVIGMTPVQLDEIITRTYESILHAPDVTVIVREFGGQQCYVMGEVQHPGAYPVVRGMTLLRAIAASGGPKVGANLKSVILIRTDYKNRVSAKRVNISLDALEKDARLDMQVNAFDMVYVPKTFISDVNAFLSQVYDVVLPPIDVWTRYKYYYNR